MATRAGAWGALSKTNGAPLRYRDPIYRNLRELAPHIRSGHVFAHIRASTGTPVQQTNCHPFRHGDWMMPTQRNSRTLRQLSADGSRHVFSDTHILG